MIGSTLRLDILTSLKREPGRVALAEAGGATLTFAELDAWSEHLRAALPALAPDATVGVLAPSGFEYVAALVAIWKAGAMAVPLQPLHPAAELEHLISDSGLGTIFTHPECSEQARSLRHGARLVEIERPSRATPETREPAEVRSDQGALMIYTSGTTSRPKGVVTTYGGLDFQVRTLIAAWGWTRRDHAVNALPLHHVHGVVNILCCALAAGACCELHPRFDARVVWERLASGAVTVFMAVPTIYSKLAAHWDALSSDEQRRLSRAAAGLRLMVSGSAALPVPLFERWRQITGHALLERYGMTEIGMALSNPYTGERRPKSVGCPLEGVEVRLVDEAGAVIGGGDVDGEIQVKGPNVFREYWGKPELTRESFTADGWFKTGDIARRGPGGYYSILGRASQDIIKCGGYKLSALEIESIMLELDDLAEVAVVGVPDAEWGERVAAACVWTSAIARRRHEGDAYVAAKAWLGTRLAHYKIPAIWRSFDSLPRNAMGKVTKSALRQSLAAAPAGQGPRFNR